MIKARRFGTLADGGYDGAGIGVFTPVKQPSDGRELDLDTRTYDALLRGLRCMGERGFALLMVGRWRALRHTASPRKIGDIVKAALVLTHFEHGRAHLKVIEITSAAPGPIQIEQFGLSIVERLQHSSVSLRRVPESSLRG